MWHCNSVSSTKSPDVFCVYIVMLIAQTIFLNTKSYSMKNLSVFWTFFLAMIFLISFQSCDKEANSLEVLPVDNQPEITLSTSKHSSTFFSNAYTTELLSDFNANFQSYVSGKEQLESQVHESEILIKKQMMSMDTHFENLYVSTIIPRGGYPLWEAGWMINVEEEASFYAVPLLKEDSEEIEGLISMVRFNDENGKTQVKGYSLTYRNELNEDDPATSNKDFYQLWFDFYDNALFDNDSAIRRDDELGFPQAEIEYYYNEGACVAGIGTVDNFYEVCLCTENLTISNGVGGLWLPIVNTPAEEAWVNANCDYAHTIDVYLDNHYSYDAGQTFLDIGMAEELGIGTFRSLVNAIDVFMDDPNSSAKVEQLYQFFYEQNLSPFGLNVFVIDDESNDIPSLNQFYPSTSGFVPYTNGAYFTPTNTIRPFLESQYPDRASRVENFWPCDVIGPAHEIACLNSLGLEQGNTNPIGFNRIPDGYRTIDVLYGDNFLSIPALHPQPAFIECKYSKSENVFTYKRQTGQFSDYRTYLSSSQNTVYPQTSIIHGLLMTTPGNVTLDPDKVVKLCSDMNIPLYHSRALHGNTPATQQDFLLTKPELLNFNDLDYSDHDFKFLGSLFMRVSVQRRFRWEFDYNITEIEFQSHIDQFVISHLIGDSNQCDTTDE